MNNYVIEGVLEFSENRCRENTLLIVHKLHRTPYHIGIITGDHYYSLTVNGPEIETREEMLAILGNKSYNNLIIELSQKSKTVEDDSFASLLPIAIGICAQKEIKELFARSELNETEFVSCLFPVRDLIAAMTSNNKFLEANNLFELLDLLKEHNLIGTTMATRMSPIMEGKIVLTRYDNEAIKKHIKRLNELKAREEN